MASKKPKYRIEIFSRIDHMKPGPIYWWRIVHRNGQILATSEMYTRKASAKRSALRFSFESYLRMLKSVEVKP